MKVRDKNMSMYKIGIVGHFGGDKAFFDGQTIKTKMIYETLKKQGLYAIDCVDSYNWYKTPFSLLYKCFQLIKKNDNIVLLPCSKGILVFIPLFFFLNCFFKKNLLYVVIGGFLPEYLQKHKFIKRCLHYYDGIFVETKKMFSALHNMRLMNTILMPNFKPINILDEEDLIPTSKGDFAFCTFSRVLKEKGIEDAISAVCKINEENKENICFLDIYGQIDENYKDIFLKLQEKFPPYVRYMGMVEPDKSTEVLKQYDILLFPTFFSGEGFPGTLIDSFASGTPSISTDWRYNSEIVDHLQNGIIYPSENFSDLIDAMKWVICHPEKIDEMKRNCLVKAKNYEPRNIIRILGDKFI